MDSEEAGKKNTDSFAMWCWGKAPRRPWTTRKVSQWAPEQLKSETLLEARVAELKLLRAHHEKAWFFGKDCSAGKRKAEGKEEGQIGEGWTPGKKP